MNTNLPTRYTEKIVDAFCRDIAIKRLLIANADTLVGSDARETESNQKLVIAAYLFNMASPKINIRISAFLRCRSEEIRNGAREIRPRVVKAIIAGEKQRISEGKDFIDNSAFECLCEY